MATMPANPLFDQPIEFLRDGKELPQIPHDQKWLWVAACLRELYQLQSRMSTKEETHRTEIEALRLEQAKTNVKLGVLGSIGLVGSIVANVLNIIK